VPVYVPAFTGTHCAYPRRDGQAELTNETMGLMAREGLCFATVVGMCVVYSTPKSYVVPTSSSSAVSSTYADQLPTVTRPTGSRFDSSANHIAVISSHNSVQ